MKARRVKRRVRHLIVSNIPRPEFFVRGYVNTLHRIFPERYTDADPFKTVWVDPMRIERADIGGHRKLGRVYGGDWDVNSSEFDKLVRVKSIYNHFVEGVPWEETEFFAEELELIDERGYDRYGCETRSEVEERFEEVDVLYKRIKEDGYKSQRQLLEELPKETVRQNNDEPLTVMNEIGVNVGREGELIFLRCGLHRLAIAKVLGLDKVPVLVRVRHREWQRIRNRVRIGEEAEYDVDTHPDLRDTVAEVNTPKTS